MNIKIGNNEYVPPFSELNDEFKDECWLIDSAGNCPKIFDVIAGINELAALRQERDSLLKQVSDLEVDLKVMKMNVDPRIVRVEFTSGEFRMVKMYTRIESRYSQSFPRVEKDFVKFCQESSAKEGEK